MTPIHLCRVTRKGRRMLSIVCAWPINAPSFSAITPPDELLLRYYCTYTPDYVPPHHPVPSELGLQPLFFVQPCSVAASAAHPTRYFHPLEREEDQEKSARLKEEKRSEVEWRKDFQDTSRLLFFPLEISAGFHTVFRVSFYRCLYFLSFCPRRIPSMPTSFFRNTMNLQFDGSTLNKSLSSHRREFDIWNDILILVAGILRFIVLLRSSYDSKSSMEGVTCISRKINRIDRTDNHFDR